MPRPEACPTPATPNEACTGFLAQPTLVRIVPSTERVKQFFLLSACRAKKPAHAMRPMPSSTESQARDIAPDGVKPPELTERLLSARHRMTSGACSRRPHALHIGLRSRGARQVAYLGCTRG